MQWLEGGFGLQRDDGGGGATMRERQEGVESQVYTYGQIWA